MSWARVALLQAKVPLPDGVPVDGRLVLWRAKLVLAARLLASTPVGRNSLTQSLSFKTKPGKNRVLLPKR